MVGMSRSFIFGGLIFNFCNTLSTGSTVSLAAPLIQTTNGQVRLSAILPQWSAASSTASLSIPEDDDEDLRRTASSEETPEPIGPPSKDCLRIIETVHLLNKRYFLDNPEAPYIECVKQISRYYAPGWSALSSEDLIVIMPETARSNLLNHVIVKKEVLQKHSLKHEAIRVSLMIKKAQPFLPYGSRGEMIITNACDKVGFGPTIFYEAPFFRVESWLEGTNPPPRLLNRYDSLNKAAVGLARFNKLIAHPSITNLLKGKKNYVWEEIGNYYHLVRDMLHAGELSSDPQFIEKVRKLLNLCLEIESLLGSSGLLDVDLPGGRMVLAHGDAWYNEIFDKNEGYKLINYEVARKTYTGFDLGGRLALLAMDDTLDMQRGVMSQFAATYLSEITGQVVWMYDIRAVQLTKQAMGFSLVSLLCGTMWFLTNDYPEGFAAAYRALGKLKERLFREGIINAP